jgi:peptidoglycan/xylan/chitin deacetylase (PgdA/CDA1 family)
MRAPRIASAPSAPQVAITMDDLNLFGADEATALDRNQAIKGAMFAAGKNIDSALGRHLLRQWNDEGHIIANHTYSHRFYPDSDFNQAGKAKRLRWPSEKGDYEAPEMDRFGL